LEDVVGVRATAAVMAAAARPARMRDAGIMTLLLDRSTKAWM
jgi:hypothetical protein